MQILDRSNIEVTRIKQLIVRACDEGCDYFKKDLIKLVDELTDYYLQNRQELRDAIISSMCEAITLLPLKSAIYATIVALLSVKQGTSSLSDSIIQSVMDRLQNISQDRTPLIGSNILCFLGELMNIGLFGGLNYVECLYDLEGGAEQDNTSFYLQILLSALPHVLIKALEKNQIEFKNIIQNIENLMNKRKRLSQYDEQDLLWQAVKKFMNTSLPQSEQIQFMQKSYPRPYYLFPEEMALVKQIRKNFKITINKREIPWIPQPILIFKVESIVSDPKVFLMQELVRQWIHSTLDSFQTNKMLLLLQFEHYTKFLGLSPIQETTLKRLTTQTLLNKLVNCLPSYEQLPSIFYSSVLISLAQRENKNDYLEYVDSAVDEIINKFHDDIVVLNYLSEFLSHFLSNISLKWNWEKYYSWVTESSDTQFAKTYFVNLFMRKLFSNLQIEKIKDLISKDLIAWYLSQQDQTKPNQESRFEIQQTEAFNQLLNVKTSADDVLSLFRSENESGKAQASDSFDIFTERLIVRMSASITHLNVLSRRYKTLYTQQDLVTRDQLQEIILQNLQLVWGHSSFHLRVYMQEWLNNGILHFPSVLKLCISKVKKIDSDNIAQGFIQLNILISLLDITKSLFHNCFNKTVDENIQEDINVEEFANITQLINHVLKNFKDVHFTSVISRIQLYLLCVAQLSKLDITKIQKQLTYDGKNIQKDIVNAVIQSIV